MAIEYSQACDNVYLRYKACEMRLTKIQAEIQDAGDAAKTKKELEYKDERKMLEKEMANLEEQKESLFSIIIT